MNVYKEGTRSLIPKGIPSYNLPVKDFKYENYNLNMFNKCNTPKGHPWTN